ncbi:hypothetical protein M885DRAFT_456056 [Pelagophyceae sp. CCMP2097]|nr:hypothetical protein M885DRAFT_456056 [Pelagophyceae sp. CCMP2097]
MAAPRAIVDAHHHYIDPANAFSKFLGGLGVPAFGCEDYAKDMTGINITKTVHVEAMPDDGAAEAAWILEMRDAGKCPLVGAIVAGCSLHSADAETHLAALKAMPLVRGIRWILDYDGAPFDGGKTNATHIATTRDSAGDLLRGDNAPQFEKGFAALAQHNFSFDLQCAPDQLPAAAALCARHPGVRVALCHLGKVKGLDGSASDAAKVAHWRAGMRLMAAQPQVCVKLSMLGYCVPGWIADEAKEAALKGLVLEVVGLFGAKRCMFATNWHFGASCSDSDGMSDVGPSAAELVAKVEAWLADVSEEDRERIFRGTATEFYRL